MKIRFKCRTCDKTVEVQEDIYEKKYAGRDECLMCRGKKPSARNLDKDLEIARKGVSCIFQEQNRNFINTAIEAWPYAVNRAKEAEEIIRELVPLIDWNLLFLGNSPKFQLQERANDFLEEAAHERKS